MCIVFVHVYLNSSCAIQGNTAEEGGAISAITSSTASFGDNAVITNNLASSEFGAALQFYDASTIVMGR